MRTTTFDMVGMALMAIVTILSTGGMLTWAYLKQQRSGRTQDAAPAASGSERNGTRSTLRSAAPSPATADDTEASEPPRVGEHRVLAGHR